MTEIVAAHLERVASELARDLEKRGFLSSETFRAEVKPILAAALAACAREALIQGRNQGIAHCLQIVQNSRSTDEHVNWLLKKLADTMGEALERAVEEKAT